MTVRKLPEGDIVTTKFTKKQNELGVEETWEEVTLECPRITDTMRLRLQTIRDTGQSWYTK